MMMNGQGLFFCSHYNYCLYSFLRLFLALVVCVVPQLQHQFLPVSDRYLSFSSSSHFASYNLSSFLSRSIQKRKTNPSYSSLLWLTWRAWCVRVCICDATLSSSSSSSSSLCFKRGEKRREEKRREEKRREEKREPSSLGGVWIFSFLVLIFYSDG